MRLAARSTAVGIAALAAFLSVVLMTTTTAALKLLLTGTTVLVMGGTGHSLSPAEDTNAFVENYIASAVGNYVAPASTLGTGVPSGPYNGVAVVTPEQFAPDTGTLTFDQSVALGQQNLDNCIKGTSCNYNTEVGSVAPAPGDTFVVYGFSQSATIATLEKRSLAAEYAPGEGPDVSFVLIANGNRPNGGFLSRGPTGVTIPWFLQFGGATFSGPTPTNTQYDTVDIAAQYDGWSDFPVNPLNLLADINAMMGITYLHLGGTYDDTTLTDPGVVDQGQYGDTHYYLISTPVLPLLMPLNNLGPLGHALADTLDAPLRVIIESAYDRSKSPGEPTSWNIFYFENPVKLTKDFLEAIPVGLDNGLQDLFGVRPFRTTRPGPYGVGGPDVTYTTPDTTDSSSSAAATDTAAAAKDSAAESTETTSTVKKSTGGFKPRVSLATPSTTATKTAAAAASAGDTKTDTKASSDSASDSTKSSTSSKHSGVGSSKRAKASAGASS
ncbi:PE-PPE domain-containing protein [Mycolicibacterium sphagni]|uniref:PE-PPE domain-containing protein n=1 Tax=Mycolicibacterium sphagni TaxID=1786 RepID=A0ABX2JK02_9MYCO|nr:PE-PPE domain-containing protein [Mycolicibacterium sphagni]NTY57969.1 PE-PPE domain-containing protein [Mycolicibacterium sphagni]